MGKPVKSTADMGRAVNDKLDAILNANLGDDAHGMSTQERQNLRDSLATLLVAQSRKVVYHGTATAPDVIRAQGLVPRGSKGADSWAAAQGFNTGTKLSGRAVVYVTPFKTCAAWYANLAAISQGTDARYIVTIKLPDDAPPLRPDVASVQALTLPDVPASWITSIDPVAPAALRAALADMGDPSKDPKEAIVDRAT